MGTVKVSLLVRVKELTYLGFYMIFISSKADEERDADEVADQTAKREIGEEDVVKLERIEINEPCVHEYINVW